MLDILAKILEWPVIVQGALGSALFSLLLYLGTKATQYSLKHSISLSRTQRLRALRTEKLRLNGAVSKDETFFTLSTVGLIYASIAYALRAAVSLVLGHLLSHWIPVLAVVGLLFALYYLFWAIESVRDLPDTEDAKLKARLKVIESEIERIEASIQRK
ncbi:MAG: hypothetical protein O9337_00145 [Acidovorax sp.]|uniref:hypothetical protein n=1 Tax=Acidovorax sp. TaxID=1872122 RepID=UPI0022C9B566|nr:hypothetical protein [Acidovorax sp.]MCZ8217796.1 hypothetical protein [Acidovorax sp.]